MSHWQRFKWGHFTWLLALSSLFIASWEIQSRLLLHFDVSWLTFAAGKMLNGGNYINNFLETNPPLILYLYTPLAFLKQNFGLSIIESIRGYVFLLSLLSLTLSSHFLKPVFQKEDQYLYYALILMLAGIFLILPVNEFGQREHLTVILTAPYLFLLNLRLLHKPIPGLFLTCFTGLLAGVGFSIKPYFLLPWLMLELYYIYRLKSLRAVLKPELLTLILFVLFYVCLILIYHQDYLYQIVPLVSQFYYQRYQRSVFRLLTCEESIYGYFMLFFYMSFRQKQTYSELQKILFISALGFWLTFLGQRMGWYYHALPFIASELLLTLVIFLPLTQKHELTLKEWVLSLLFLISFWGWLWLKMPYIRLSSHFFTYSYLFFFSGILCTLLWLNASFRLSPYFIYSSGLLLFVNLVFYHYLSVSNLHESIFSLSSLMFFLIYAYLSPAKSSSQKCQNIILSFLAVFIFALPAYKMAYIYDYASYYKVMYTRLTDTMKHYAGRKVVYLSNASEMAFPNMDYSGQIYSSRFWSLSWLPAMEYPYTEERYQSYSKNKQDQLNFYLRFLLTDLEKNKPDYIFVDVRTKGYLYTLPPNYVHLFSFNKDFREIWKHYQYLETLDQRPLFKLEVYRKI